MAKALKTRIHFNRINMNRGRLDVWTAHNSHGCFAGKKIIIKHKGKVIAETVFNPAARQPRAFILVQGTVKVGKNSTVVEV